MDPFNGMQPFPQTKTDDMLSLASAVRLVYNGVMIVIYTALYHEAKPIIDHFRLQKAALPAPVPGRVQWFTGTHDVLGPIHLVVGGTGPLAAAIGTTYALTRLQTGSAFFLNVGIAGGRRADRPVGEAILCHKIVHHDTGREYYPDILIPHPFREGVLETFSRPVIAAAQYPMEARPANEGVPCSGEPRSCASNREAREDSGAAQEAGASTNTVTGDVVDMEGAGCFEAASAFLPPHRLFFVKIVSDHLNVRLPEHRPCKGGAAAARIAPDGPASLDGATVARLVAAHVPALERLLLDAQEMEDRTAKPLLSPEEEELLRALAEQLRLSVTMGHQFRQLCLQYKAAGGHDLAARLRPWLGHPVQHKHERNAIFARIRQALLPH